VTEYFPPSAAADHTIPGSVATSVEVHCARCHWGLSSAAHSSGTIEHPEPPAELKRQRPPREHPAITRNREHRNDLVWQPAGRKQYERFDGARIVYNHNRWLWDTFTADGVQQRSYTALWAAKESFPPQGAP
jgi:hypothetical protein